MDGVEDELDNCEFDFNPDQADTVPDGVGDACAPDFDLDVVEDALDNCPYDFNPKQDPTACKKPPVCMNTSGCGPVCLLELSSASTIPSATA